MMNRECTYSGMLDNCRARVEKNGKPWTCEYQHHVGDKHFCSLRSPRVVIFCTSNVCNFKCVGDYGCIAECQKISTDRISKLDVGAAIEWTKKYAPLAHVHVTGGEPFAIDGMVESIRKIINAGFKVSVFTNGSLLRKFENDGVYYLPVSWQITHHYQRISTSEFFRNIEPLKNKPHVVCRIIGKGKHRCESIERMYDGYNFKWINDREGFADYSIETKWDNHPCSEMILLGIKNEVFPCSSPFRVIGNVVDMTFDEKAASELSCVSDKYPHDCQACQSAEILEQLHKGV